MPTLNDLPTEMHRMIGRAAIVKEATLHVGTVRALQAVSSYWTTIVDAVIDEELCEMEKTKKKVLTSKPRVTMDLFEMFVAEERFRRGVSELQDERYKQECYKPQDEDAKYLIRDPSVGLPRIKWQMGDATLLGMPDKMTWCTICVYGSISVKSSLWCSFLEWHSLL